MDTPATRRLEAYLASAVEALQRIRQLDLSMEDDCEQALTESREAIGALAMYRALIGNLEESNRHRHRYAA